MSGREHFFDRLVIQEGWWLSRLWERRFILCGRSPGMVRTLGLAAASSGITNLVLVGECDEGDGFLLRAAEHVMTHLGSAGRYVPVHSPSLYRLEPHVRGDRIWVIDAGDPLNDSVIPGEQAHYYAECRASGGQDYIAVGTDRADVSRERKGVPLTDRAEVPAAAAHILTGIMARLNVSEELEPLPPFCRIPLARLPKDPDVSPPSAVLYAGGGGAVAHQEIWAESLDPILRRANERGHFIVVDPKAVHESCRSRQWGYPPEAVNEMKAKTTARWIEELFPGARVSVFTDRLQERHFRQGNPREALSSMDTWGGRRVLAEIAGALGIPWWSAGTSFLAGFARQVSAANPLCASAFDGVERLGERTEDDGGEGDSSCTGPATPAPSSVLPQMVVGSWIACQRRAVLLGEADPRVLARGIEVDLSHGSTRATYEGLRYSPGRRLNLTSGGRR